MENDFYMVWVEGENTPTYRHDTYDSATKEAERLTRILNKKAYILRAVTYIIKTDVMTVILARQGSNDDLPF